MTSTPPRTTASTPQTPPTPLHGSRRGVYASTFSPRRSSRISNKYSDNEVSEAAVLANRSQANGAKMRRLNAESRTPLHTSWKQFPSSRTASPDVHKQPFYKNSHQPFSPPSSPTSPRKKASQQHRQLQDDSHDLSYSRHDVPTISVSSNSNFIHSQPRAQQSNISMLPTPLKTPRKARTIPSAQMHSTARALFTDTNVESENVVTTPRRSRKGRALTIESFNEGLQQGTTNDIPIYTDPRERIPEIDESENNPFYQKNSSSKTATRGRKATKKTNSGSNEEERKAVENDEGILYVFRGKKIFRRFNDINHPSNSYERDALDDQDGLRRMAGDSTLRHFTRSSLKPRLLFPDADNVESHDEEALTDIDETIGNQTDGKNLTSKLQQTTEPLQYAYFVPSSATQSLHNNDQTTSDSATRVQSTAKQDVSPFDSWQRKKNVSKRQGAKRQGEAIDQLEAGRVSGKKTRTGNS